ncbi:MAG: T9SS type A sorting domain-containing protein [Candidatus Methanoperedens sp.]|nr:T9SS type A sorting domain-containing protein [Candidatus Methanoperedens sp.]
MNKNKVSLGIVLGILVMLFISSTALANTPATAGTLPLNGAVGGIISDTSTEDWWTVTATQDGNLTVSLTVTGTAYGIVSIYDISGTTWIVQDAVVDGTTSKSVSSNLKAGTYFVRVSGVRVSGVSGAWSWSYTLSNTFIPAPLANDPEPNDGYTSANVLTLNGQTTGHLGYFSNGITDIEDWWKVTTTQDGNLAVGITGTGTADGIVSIYDISGTTWIVQDAVAGTTPKSVSSNLKAGTYFVRVSRVSGAWSYTLSNTFTPAPLANDPEPNDGYTSANVLTLNGQTTGHLGYFSNGITDMEDWWKVTTTQEGNLAVGITGTGTADGYVSIYDTTGTTWIVQDAVAGTTPKSVSSNLKAGTYFVRVSRVSGAWSYTLSNTFTPKSAVVTPTETPKTPCIDATPYICPDGSITSVTIDPITGCGYNTCKTPDKKTTDGTELITNGAFSNGLSGWTIMEWFKPSDGKGEVTAESDGIRFLSKSGNNNIGIMQTLNADVSGCTALNLRATIKADEQTLSGTGWNGRESPIAVFARYTDINGVLHGNLGENPKDPNRMLWTGLYFIDPTGSSITDYGIKTQKGVWYTYETDLMKLSPKPKIIDIIGAEGAGWPIRDGKVKSISLTCVAGGVPPTVPPTTVPPSGNELITNGAFSNSLSGWTIQEWYKPSDGKGEVTVESGGIRFRSISGNNHIGIMQTLNADVSGCAALNFRATLRADEQTLSGTGWNGRESPISVFARYTDVNGVLHGNLGEDPNEQNRMFWTGLYFIDPTGSSITNYGIKTQKGEWYTYETDLMKLSPKPKIIDIIGAEGAGWPIRDGKVKSISLTCVAAGATRIPIPYTPAKVTYTPVISATQPKVTTSTATGDFTIGISPTSITVNPGDTLKLTLTVMPVAGFNEPVDIYVKIKALGQEKDLGQVTTIYPPYKPFMFENIVPNEIPKGATIYGYVTARGGGLERNADTVVVKVPGFEMVAAILTVGMAMLIIRRRKN